jgi:transposase
MHCATKTRCIQVVVGLIWMVSLLAFVLLAPASGAEGRQGDRPVLPTEVLADPSVSAPWRWWPRRRLRKWAWQRYCVLQHAHRRAQWVARAARLALSGALTFAQVVDLLTQAQLQRQLGALPVLYMLLDILQVRAIINRHCPTAAEVDHGTVALVLILNRLTAPRALYRVADWLAQTVLVETLGLPAAKFNDDRLGRTLEALQAHSRDIWLDIVHQALVRFDIDLSLLFYDLTAFTVHGEYAASQWCNFGFAHNTPLNKRKLKLGLNTAADGNIPVDYWPWAGHTADQATVQANMERLCRLLRQHGWPCHETVLIGDRAMLNAELAHAYQAHGLHYLAALQPRTSAHCALLRSVPTPQLRSAPLIPGYWGKPVAVVFTHQGGEITHRGLLVLSGPMRAALRRTRAQHLWALRQELLVLREKIGAAHYRTVKAMERHVRALLKRASGGQFMQVQVTTDARGQLTLRWRADRYALWQADQQDGRYLLVTNDAHLTPLQMLTRYRQKDGGEKRFTVCKSDLKVSPIYLHKDERIEGLLLIHMVALLTYSLLERQARQGGIPMTTRRILTALETLSVVETRCWDGSRLWRLAPMDEAQLALVQALQTLLQPFYQLPMALPQPSSNYEPVVWQLRNNRPPALPLQS